jgi:uncharacterized SAM-binding protein YcdF (DUF218 family)
MGLRYPVVEVGPVADTHDEALAVARLAHEKKWDRVILVTHPWHMKRAVAVFQKAGVNVIPSACVEGRYAWRNPDGVKEKLLAYLDWAHEFVGYYAYRKRGWV